MKIHFGSGNDSAEDYYYVSIGDCTIAGLGLGIPSIRFKTVTEETTILVDIGSGDVELLSSKVNNGQTVSERSGIKSFAIIPENTTDLKLTLYDRGANDSLEIFTRDGKHIIGTELGGTEWDDNNVYNATDMENKVLTPANGFQSDPAPIYDSSNLNGTGYNVTPYNPTPPYKYPISYNGMNFGYSGDGNDSGYTYNESLRYEYLTLDKATEDLVILSVGSGAFELTASWTSMPDQAGVPSGKEKRIITTEKIVAEPFISEDAYSIKTQQAAQEALERIDNAIVIKDKIRADLGALQNRLENTITNITTQAENLQAAESRISDVDVATEMTEFVRQQILAQSAVAMLSQANSMPQMAMQLIGG